MTDRTSLPIEIIFLQHRPYGRSSSLVREGKVEFWTGPKAQNLLKIWISPLIAWKLHDFGQKNLGGKRGLAPRAPWIRWWGLPQDLDKRLTPDRKFRRAQSWNPGIPNLKQEFHWKPRLFTHEAEFPLFSAKTWPVKVKLTLFYSCVLPLLNLHLTDEHGRLQSKWSVHQDLHL